MAEGCAHCERARPSYHALLWCLLA